jgi:hypothetical protein
MPDESIARPRWYSHGWNRLACYRRAGAAAERQRVRADLARVIAGTLVRPGEQDAGLERYLRREGERLRFVTRRHATSPFTIEATIRAKSGEEPVALAARVATLPRAVRAQPTRWFNFFDTWSSPRVAA